MTNNLHYKCQTSSHSVPCFIWHSKNKSTFTFQTANKNLSGWIWGVQLLLFLLWFEVRKWHIALHSFTVLTPSLPVYSVIYSTDCQPWSVQIYKSQVRYPPRTGIFFKSPQSKIVWIATLLDWLIKTYRQWDSTEMTSEMLSGHVWRTHLSLETLDENCSWFKSYWTSRIASDTSTQHEKVLIEREMRHIADRWDVYRDQ